MFGYVAAHLPELTDREKKRYGAVYCGICRQIREQCSSKARLALRYDMAFLSLLLMSLYEPEETSGKKACRLHPIRPRPWIDNEYIAYGAAMNIALAYYQCMDDYQDEGKEAYKKKAEIFEAALDSIRASYPRQCQTMETCLQQLSDLEKENCPDPDAVAACFGNLMAELLVYKEDLWAVPLRKMGMTLGRYIYLADAAVDYRKDRKKGRYNPYLAAGTGEDRRQWDENLLLAMGRCTDYFERLPLVQDKKILDNILYSGIWVEYRRRMGTVTREEQHGR